MADTTSLVPAERIDAEALEEKYDSQFSVVFDALRELMVAPEPSDRPIGFKGAP